MKLLQIFSILLTACQVTLFRLYHTTTFEQFSPPRLTHFYIFIRYYYKIIVARRSFSDCPFILPLILSAMCLICVNKHQVPQFAITFIYSDPMMLFLKNYNLDRVVPFFESMSLFLLRRIVMCRNSVCFNSILFISRHYKWASLKRTPV